MGRLRDITLLYISIISYFVMAVTILFMSTENYAFRTTIAIIFYIGLIIGIVTQVLLSKRRRNWIKENKVSDEKMLDGRIGLLAIAQNRFALVADGACVVSLIAFIISHFVSYGLAYVGFVFLAIFIFAFCMHCVLNGKVYYYITNKRRLLKKERSKNS